MNDRRKVARLVAAAALALTLTGCGRDYHIRGRVVYLPELEAAESLILEFTGKPLPRGGRPLPGAKVRMLHKLEKDGRPAKDEGPWTREVVTDEQGAFEIQDYSAPYKESQVGLEVSLPGYRTAYQTYTDDADQEPQTFLILLAPDAKH